MVDLLLHWPDDRGVRDPAQVQGAAAHRDIYRSRVRAGEPFAYALRHIC